MASTTFTLQTQQRTYYKIHTDDQTPDSVPTRGFSQLTPGVTGAGIMECKYANLAKLVFTGDADGKTGCAFVWGWSKMASGEWLANFIAEITFTCGTLTGASNAVFDTTDYFADIVELEYGDTATKVITDTQNNIASATVDLEGAALIEVQFSDETTDGVPPTGINLNVAVSLF